MRNPIIDKLQAQIQDSRTAGYFAEVLSCYYSGNLRSAVVMLYATVICDLVYKLEDLRTLYNDKGAQKILDDLEKQQNENPKNTDWEKKVPEECMKMHKILNAADYSNFVALQQLRHLCAHPVIANNNVLYQPNPDIVLGHIRNMLDGIFTKPAFHVKELFAILLEDLASVKNFLVDEESIERYVVSKYLDKFNSVELELQIFKKLWKFVFALDNDDCDTNRLINKAVLMILVRRHLDLVLDFFAKERDYFSRQINDKNRDLLILLIMFFNEFPDFYSVLPDATQLEINAVIDNSQSSDLKGLSIFRCSDVVKHILGETLRCSNKYLGYFSDLLEHMVGHEVVLDYYISLYACSGNYNRADFCFDEFIEPHIAEFTEEQVKRLIESTENNGQISGRWKARPGNQIIKDRMLALNANFDFTIYRHFA